MNRVYAIKTKSFDGNGHLVCEGIVGIFTSLKKALAAMDSQREFAKVCIAILTRWIGQNTNSCTTMVNIQAPTTFMNCGGMS